MGFLKILRQQGLTTARHFIVDGALNLQEWRRHLEIHSRRSETWRFASEDLLIIFLLPLLLLVQKVTLTGSVTSLPNKALRKEDRL